MRQPEAKIAKARNGLASPWRVKTSRVLFYPLGRGRRIIIHKRLEEPNYDGEPIKSLRAEILLLY